MKYIFRTVCLILLVFSVSFLNAQNDQVKIEKLSDKFYKFICTNGANDVNTLALVGEEGILLIDAGFQQTADELKSKIESLGKGNVEILINTHLHGDHTGANNLFAKDSIMILAHENTLNRMKGFYGQLSDITKEALANVTVGNDMTMSFNNETIRLIYFPGHSDGDIVVWFPESNIVFMGDLLLTNGFPSVETGVGGDIETYIESFGVILDYFSEDCRFIPGHGDDYSYEEMEDYYKMIVNTSDVIRAGLNEGKSVDKMISEDILKAWRPEKELGATAAYWIGAVAGSLTNKDTKTPIAEPVLNALINESVEASILLYKELKSDKSDVYDFRENDLNMIGYYLMGKKRYKDAVEIFKLNVEEYPDAFNVYDSLGEAYMESRDKKRAIKNYERSLEINPNNTNAVEMIKKIKGR